MMAPTKKIRFQTSFFQSKSKNLTRRREAMAHRVRRLLENPKLRPNRMSANMVTEMAAPENRHGQGLMRNSHMIPKN
jgi:hypothetical protein